MGNLIVYRLNQSLGFGRIIKKLDIPTSKSLEKEDTSFITKYKVSFENNIIKILHPVDLIHKIFKINDRVITKKGIGTINAEFFYSKDSIISYEILFSNGKLEQVFESEIYAKYYTPIKELFKGKRFDPPSNFLIKYWANLFYSYYTSYQVKCITNSRLSLMPHQINVAHRLSEEYLPRMILADEVGLGKTIEAGIYIKESMARNLAQRVLIIVPATLVKQWKFELLNKFNIDFEIYDGTKVKEFKKNYKRKSFFKNPFYNNNLIICSLQFARNKKYIDLLSKISWDIVVFDEAHHLRRYLINATTGNYRETLNYELARNLSATTESMLLLSATPLQLHSFELYSLIELIKREAFDNFSDFEHFRKNIPFINLLVSNINNIEKLNSFELKNTIKLLRDLKYIDKKSSDSEVLQKVKDSGFRINILKKVEKDHTLTQFLIRNRKKNVFTQDFLNERIVKTIIVNPTKQELDLYKEIRLYLAKIYNSSMSKENVGIGFIITTLQKLLTSSKFAFLKSLERRLEQIDRLKSIELDILIEEDPEFFESELEDEYLDSEIIFNGSNNYKEDKKQSIDLLNQEKILSDFYNKLKNLPYDSKCDALNDLVKQIYDQNPLEKILIFTQFVDTLFYLKDLLKKQEEPYDVEIFYGGMDKEEKDKAVERFRTSEGLGILISTEVGGEGRNFQFARVLINYDLPWNPMKLEQRIGRLDRIGQKSKQIFIYNIYLEGTIEADIMLALDKRIHLFEESIGQLEPIIGTIEKDIKSIIFSEEAGTQRKRLNEFNRKVDNEVKKAREMEMQLDDLLIDRKSFQTDDLITSLEACQEVKLSHNELYTLIKTFLNLEINKFGKLNDSLGSETNIELSNTLLDDYRYKLQKNYKGTFNLELARKKEEIDFFALGHPLVNSILDYCRSDSFNGNFTKLSVQKSKLPQLFKVGLGDQLYLFIFVVKFQGYILERQYSAIIVDKNGTEIEEITDYLLDINNFENLYLINNHQIMIGDLNGKFIETLTEKAKNLVKRKISQWKVEIKALNDKIFKKESAKKEKIYEHRNRVLNLKLEALKRTLEKQETKRPTKRQKINIQNMTDVKKRKEREEQIILLEEQIKITKLDIEKLERKIDDLSFEYNDLKNEMKKRNLAKFYTNLDAFAIIEFN